MQASVKEDRQLWIGGSDIPTIMGISHFSTRWELLLFKVGLKESEFDGNEYTEYGNKMESKIRDYINEDQKSKFKETKYEYRETGIRCHLDGENDNKVLEIKTTSQIHDKVNDYEVYLVQLLFYMMQVGKNKGILAVYHRPEDFNEELNPERLQIFNIDIEDYKELCNDIEEEVKRFKEDINKLKENPLLAEEDLLPDTVKEISHELEMIEHKLQMYKELEQEEKELKKQLYNAMLEHNIKRWKTPTGIQITRVDGTEDKPYMEFNEEKFSQDQPVVYASYCEEKIKKGKSGYIKIT